MVAGEGVRGCEGGMSNTIREGMGWLCVGLSGFLRVARARGVQGGH